MTAKQCFNSLSNKYNKIENFHNLEKVDKNKMKINHDLKKMSDLYCSITVLRNIVDRKYGDYYLTEKREIFTVKDVIISIPIITGTLKKDIILMLVLKLKTL